jgi:hypothetical protein
MTAIDRSILDDDALADSVAGRCNDPSHDPRYCPTCEARAAGIADYREAIRDSGKRRAAPNLIDCNVVVEDLREYGGEYGSKHISVYNTELGQRLTAHCVRGEKAIHASVILPDDIAEDVRRAWQEHGAYLLVRLLPAGEPGEGRAQ